MYQNRNKEMEIISLYRGNYGARFYLREISKLSKLPLKTCQDALSNLEKNRILKGKTEGKNKYFSLNIDNIKTKSYLLQAEIYQTDAFMENYPHVKLFLKSLDTAAAIIVFGSFAKFQADKDSDLDLLVVSGEKRELPLHLLSYKVHKIELSEKDFTKAMESNETLIKEIEEGHIILNNHSFYVNIRWSHYAR